MKHFTYRLRVPPQAIDMHGHVNNTYYFVMMQEAAFAHSDAVGDTLEEQHKRGGVWLVRQNEATYLLPAKLGDELEILTWTSAKKRASSERHFEFRRDGELIATAKTTFIYFDTNSNRAKAIPPEIIALYE